MKLVWWMVAGSVTSSLAMTAILGVQTGPAIGLGMSGPLIAILLTWISVERLHNRHPERVTALLVKAFAAKMVFFAAYIGLILGADLVRPMPFVISFTAYFLALHITMAISLRRLMSTGSGSSVGAFQTSSIKVN